jgi:hypothetical protein
VAGWLEPRGVRHGAFLARRDRSEGRSLVDQLVFDGLGEFLMVYLELIPELSAKAENPMKTIG